MEAVFLATVNAAEYCAARKAVSGSASLRCLPRSNSLIPMTGFPDS